tara:strand:+ start:838 stop:1071 length:234 start_codon:yes stop_codon:yes gene_type:complete
MAKRGRKPGSTYAIAVSLKELNRVLKEDATVMVSHHYAKQLNLSGKRAAHEDVHEAAESVARPVEFKVSDLSEEDSW